MRRYDGRSPDKLRTVTITRNYLKHAEGSCLIEFGETKIICSATIEETVPVFLKNSGTGWVTAEYGLLPRSCETRIMRNKTSGRTFEIQRLIGRSLRGVVDMQKLGERTIKIDCDVIQADGGTRTASITGGFIALADALLYARKQGLIDAIPLTDYVAAISVGISNKQKLLDLTYQEDSRADMDMNVVILGNGTFMEVQGTAEGAPFSKEELDMLLELARNGINELIELQKKTLNNII